MPHIFINNCELYIDLQCAGIPKYSLLLAKCYRYINPLTSMSDQDRISPYNINQKSDENKEKDQFADK